MVGWRQVLVLTVHHEASSLFPSSRFLTCPLRRMRLGLAMGRGEGAVLGRWEAASGMGK